MKVYVSTSTPRSSSRVAPSPSIVLFNYGSNHPQQLEERLGKTTKNFAAYLPGYGRVFRGYSANWGGGVATIVKDPARTVYGYGALVTKADIDRMQTFEGSRYSPQQIALRLKNGMVLPNACYAFIRNDGNSDYSPPSRRYLEAIVKTIGGFWSNPDGSRVGIDDIKLS